MAQAVEMSQIFTSKIPRLLHVANFFLRHAGNWPVTLPALNTLGDFGDSFL